MTEERTAIYMESLSDLDAEDVEKAFRRSLLTCKFFPSIAEIRSQLKADESFEAEKAWDLIVRIHRHHWHPDIGYHSNPPVMDRAALHALNTIGGMNAISATMIENTGFLRRDFLAAHKRHSETAGYLAPTKDEAKGVIEGIQKGELRHISEVGDRL